MYHQRTHSKLNNLSDTVVNILFWFINSLIYSKRLCIIISITTNGKDKMQY